MHFSIKQLDFSFKLYYLLAFYFLILLIQLVVVKLKDHFSNLFEALLAVLMVLQEAYFTTRKPF